MTHDVLKDFTREIWGFAWQHFQPTADDAAPPEWTETFDPACTIVGTDEERIALALRSRSAGGTFGGRVTFRQLWEADADALARQWPGNTGSYDASSVDQAFFNHLSFWFGNNCERMLTVAAQSKLVREKWNRPDYIRSTILKACALPKQWKTRGKAAAALALPAPAAVEAPPPPAAAPAPPGTIPAPPDSMPPPAPPALGVGAYISAFVQADRFAGYVYINDIHRIISPDGFLMKKDMFDAHVDFAGREYQLDNYGKKSDSAWEAFVMSKISQGVKVRGMLFDPRETPGAIIEREGQAFVNTWCPVPIRAVPGDVTPFLQHLQTLFVDWRLLLNYMKFQVQQKGTKVMWWPFIYGMPGNGKSFISATMQYCIGEKYTRKPKASNLGSQFNAELYGALFLAVDDVKVQDDYTELWETLKPMITETRLEIQPKGVDKVTREVCFNAILNSNHKNGIRKEPDDRRIASFFSRQQKTGDLERDGLTEAYFTWLWNWAQSDGWAHVAHYLSTEPIDEDFSATKCPITTSTAEHIEVSRSPAEQEIMQAVRSGSSGFKAGWINILRVGQILDMKRNRSSLATRRDMVERLGYIPHPGLPDGQLLVPLNDGTLPTLYVLANHPMCGLTDPKQVKAAYEAAQT